MSFRQLQRDWEAFGRTDPMWAVLTDPKKVGRRWQPASFLATGRAEIAALLVALKNAGIRLRFGSALDFGSGAGRLSQALGDHFVSVTGVDIAATMVEEARRLSRGKPHVQFVHNPSQDLRQFSSNTFDLVYSSLTLQHIPPTYSKAYLAEFCRVLKPGGVLAVRIPERRVVTAEDRMSVWRRCKWFVRRQLPNSLVQRIGSWWAHWRGRPRMELHGIPQADVRRILSKAGMEHLVVLPDAAVGPGESWRNYLYLAVKPSGR